MLLAVVRSRGSISIANRYRLLTELSYTAAGTVWRARDEHLDRDVAITEVYLPGNTSRDSRSAFLESLPRTARAPSQLGHSSIIDVHDVLVEYGRPWIVTELAGGLTLEQRVTRNGPLALDEVTDIARRLLDALDTAHRAGILHRDIRPGNVLLADDGRVLLTGFVLTVPGGTPAPGSSETLLPEPAQVAPEVAKGGEATPGSDLWCLGATLYAALEGHAPYDRKSLTVPARAAFGEQPPPPRPTGTLSSVIMGLLEEDPARRLSHARAADRLKRSVTVPPPNRRKADRRRLLVAVSLVAATCMVGVIGLGGLTLGVMRERPSAHERNKAAPATTTPRAPTDPAAEAPRGAESDALVIRAVGDQCRIFVARPGNTEVVFDGVLAKGQIGRYDMPTLDAVVQNAAACDVWINGRRQPAGTPGERKRYTVRNR
jgi:hypothetical protein